MTTGKFAKVREEWVRLSSLSRIIGSSSPRTRSRTCSLWSGRSPNLFLKTNRSMMKMLRIAPKELMMQMKILRLNLTICRIWLSDKRRKLSQLQNFKLIKTSCSKFRKLRVYRIHSDPKFWELVSKRSKSNRIKLLSLSQKTYKFKKKISNLMILEELWISKSALLSSHSKRSRDSLAQSVWI